jgi:hypothetical protein
MYLHLVNFRVEVSSKQPEPISQRKLIKSILQTQKKIKGNFAIQNHQLDGQPHGLVDSVQRIRESRRI